MGHDFIEYKEQNVRLHDFNIWMLRHFLIRASHDEDFIKFIENIEWLGPGVFSGTELYEYVGNNKNRLKILLSSLNEAKKLIKSFGDYIPLEYLEKNVNLKSSYFTTKQPVAEYVQNIESIIEAIEVAENA